MFEAEHLLSPTAVFVRTVYRADLSSFNNIPPSTATMLTSYLLSVTEIVIFLFANSVVSCHKAMYRFYSSDTIMTGLFSVYLLKLLKCKACDL